MVKNIHHRIGIMQGRLSPMINGKIQCFPWDHWKEEFPLAKECSFNSMEWTIDAENLYSNPIFTMQSEIQRIVSQYRVTVPSLTADCFMQMPFFKSDNSSSLLKDLDNLIVAASNIGVKTIVIPLVDNSSILNDIEENVVVHELNKKIDLLTKLNMRIAFESDYPPEKLLTFINKFPLTHFGINYDLGNSASLGYNPTIELTAYGHRVLNVHIKDRKLHGTTVPLGEGDVNFNQVLSLLNSFNYQGNFILQTARSTSGEDLKFARIFFNFLSTRLDQWNWN